MLIFHFFRHVKSKTCLDFPVKKGKWISFFNQGYWQCTKNYQNSPKFPKSLNLNYLPNSSSAPLTPIGWPGKVSEGGDVWSWFPFEDHRKEDRTENDEQDEEDGGEDHVNLQFLLRPLSRPIQTFQFILFTNFVSNVTISSYSSFPASLFLSQTQFPAKIQHLMILPHPNSNFFYLKIN